MRNINSLTLQRYILEHSKSIVKTSTWNLKQKWISQSSINYFLGLTLPSPGTMWCIAQSYFFSWVFFC